MEKVVLLGAGGHCKVIMDILKGCYDIAGITDIDENKINKKFYGIDVIGNDEILRYIYCNGIKKAIVTLGSIGDGRARAKLFELALGIGFDMINVFSRTSVVSPSARFGSGNVIMDGAIIHSDSVIGHNTIINTGSIVEHDCCIENHVHISPGAKLAGGVHIGEGSHIGMNATVIQGLRIGKNCIIGAGAVVLENIPDNSVCVGIPARKIKNTNWM